MIIFAFSYLISLSLTLKFYLGTYSFSDSLCKSDYVRIGGLYFGVNRGFAMKIGYSGSYEEGNVKEDESGFLKSKGALCFTCYFL